MCILFGIFLIIVFNVAIYFVDWFLNVPGNLSSYNDQQAWSEETAKNHISGSITIDTEQ